MSRQIKAFDELKSALAQFDIELIELDAPQRKGRLFQCRDMRTGLVLCSYSTLAQIRDWAHRKLAKPWSRD